MEQGKIAKAEFIIPTVHNMMAIERALRVAAGRYVSADRVALELSAPWGAWFKPSIPASRVRRIREKGTTSGMVTWRLNGMGQAGGILLVALVGVLCLVRGPCRALWRRKTR